MKWILALCLLSLHLYAHPQLDDYIESNVVGKNLPTASLLIRNGKDNLYQHHVSNDGRSVNSQGLYDLASLTKVYTVLAIKILLDETKLNQSLDTFFQKEFKLSQSQKNILRRHNVFDLLYHETMFRDVYGLYFEQQIQKKPIWDIIFDRVGETRVSTKRFRYKDIHFILLGKIVEIESGMNLSEFFRVNIFDKLGLSNTYVFSLNPEKAREVFLKSKVLTLKNIARLKELQKELPSKSLSVFNKMTKSYNLKIYNRRRSAFTNNKIEDIYNYRYLVHDPVARIMGGFAGHAGVISSLEDLSKVIDVFMDSRQVAKTSTGFEVSPKKGLHKDLGLSYKEIFESFSLVRKSGRGQGLDISSRYSASSRGGEWKYGKILGSVFRKKSFGLTGYTGTSFLVDTCSGLNYILLTNRTHHRLGKNPSLNETRRKLAKLIIQHYQPGPQDECRYRENEK